MSSPAPSSPLPHPTRTLLSSPELSSDSDSDVDGAGGSDIDELELDAGGGSDGEPGPSASGTGGKKRALEEVLDAGPAACQWDHCGEEFWEMESLIEHIHNLHAFPPDLPAPKKGALTYICHWAGCPRKGKNQNSKFSLVSHLRSHTGEKPFTCPRPECDKSFTRTDALQKHMRIQHAEVIIPGRRHVPGPQPSKRSKKGRAASIDSEDDDASVMGAGAAATADDDEEPLWSEEQLALFEDNPGQNRFFLGYVLELAKGRYLGQEHEGLLGELEALGRREAELGAECEELMRRCLRKEAANDPSDPHNAQALELFLTEFDHVPEKLPAKWKSS